MAVVSQNADAKRIGISKQAISKAIKEGRIVRGKNGIDPNDPTNIEFEMRHLEAREVKARERRASAETFAFESQATDLDNLGISNPIEALSKQTADKLKVIEQIRHIQVKTDQQRKKRIERSLVQRLFGHLYLVDTNEPWKWFLRE